MKRLIICGLLSILFFSIATAQSPYRSERTGYEGDFFSLEGALEQFKNSYTLREFERRLNTRDNWVNNLDLDYDGRTDYIRVEHRRQGNFHAIVLQAILDRYDIQDVAVIEIEVIGRREAVLQIIGDEDLYGEQVIVEPVEGYSDSRSRGYQPDYGDFVNVYYWEPVQYLLGQQYREVYVSPYRWQYYPTWWRPWQPCGWNIFRPRIVVYQRYFNVVHVHRVVRVHNFYWNFRSYSPVVVQRANRVRVQQGRAPIYRPARPVSQNPRADSRPQVYQPRPRTSETTRPGRSALPNEPTRSTELSRKRSQADAARVPDGRPVESRPRSSTADRPGRSTGPDIPSRSPILSRKQSQADADRMPERDRPQLSDRSRSTGREGSRPTTSSPRPAVREREAPRSSAPSIERPSRNTTPRSRVTPRPSVPERKPTIRSGNSRSTSPQVSRNSSSRIQQPSRSTPDRSGTISRSRSIERSPAPSRKPAASQGRSQPSAKPGTSRSSGAKSNSQKPVSRSRRGGEQ